jgi:membrane complex biogenesis BtpA family protein
LEKKPVIGMIHLPSFESSVSPDFNLEETFRISLTDALTLRQAGFDALLIENFHDTPFPKTRISDTKFLMMSKIVNKIIESVPDISVGVNILRNACLQALTIATINHASFIRCNIWEGAYVTDQGIIEGIASEVIHEKQVLQSKVMILADVGVKHATPLGQFSLEESAKNALSRGGADRVILSGRETGALIPLDTLTRFVSVTKHKPILGSGVTVDNVSTIFPLISGVIIGSALKYDSSNLHSPIDLEKATTFMSEWNALREK